MYDNNDLNKKTSAEIDAELSQPFNYEWIQIPFMVILLIVGIVDIVYGSLDVFYPFAIVSIGLSIGAVSHRKDFSTKRSIAIANIVFVSLVFITGVVFFGLGFTNDSEFSNTTGKALFIVSFVLTIFAFGCGLAGAINSIKISNYNLKVQKANHTMIY